MCNLVSVQLSREMAQRDTEKDVAKVRSLLFFQVAAQTKFKLESPQIASITWKQNSHEAYEKREKKFHKVADD